MSHENLILPEVGMTGSKVQGYSHPYLRATNSAEGSFYNPKKWFGSGWTQSPGGGYIAGSVNITSISMFEGGIFLVSSRFMRTKPHEPKRRPDFAASGGCPNACGSPPGPSWSFEWPPWLSASSGPGASRGTFSTRRTFCRSWGVSARTCGAVRVEGNGA